MKSVTTATIRNRIAVSSMELHHCYYSIIEWAEVLIIYLMPIDNYSFVISDERKLRFLHSHPVSYPK